MGWVISKDVPTKNGRKRKVFIARWKDRDGKQREKSFGSKSAAKEHAFRMSYAEEKPREDPDNPYRLVPFDQVARIFLEHHRTESATKDALEESTTRGYESLLKNHIIPALKLQSGLIGCNGINENDLQRIVLEMERKGCSFDRIKRAIMTTRQVLQFAHRRKMRVDPAPTFELIKPPSVKRAEMEKAEEVFQPHEIRTLLRAADSLAGDDNKGTRKAWASYRPMLYLYVHTGLRLSEGRAIRLQDFDFSKMRVLVRQTADEKGQIKPPKSLAGRRDVPMSKAIADVVGPYLEGVEGPLAFPTRNGTPKAINNLHRRMFAPLMTRANEMAENPIKSLGPHAIRHAFASRLIAAGFNLKQLQVWMGHHDPAFTLRVYGHLFDEEIADFSERMEIPA